VLATVRFHIRATRRITEIQMAMTPGDPSPSPAYMDSTSLSGSAPIFAMALVSAMVAIISLLAFDFGGWYERIPFVIMAIQRWHYIGLQ
jgi:hypothetical protein